MHCADWCQLHFLWRLDTLCHSTRHLFEDQIALASPNFGIGRIGHYDNVSPWLHAHTHLDTNIVQPERRSAKESGGREHWIEFYELSLNLCQTRLLKYTHECADDISVYLLYHLASIENFTSLNQAIKCVFYFFCQLRLVRLGIPAKRVWKTSSLMHPSRNLIGLSTHCGMNLVEVPWERFILFAIGRCLQFIKRWECVWQRTKRGK